ncbi:MAG: hypothetical protein WCJ30_06060 [Deltaproteobacteria bacterium]
MTAAKPLPLEPQEDTSFPMQGTALAPVFEVQLRRRHDDKAAVEVVRIAARTIASARHAARLGHPDRVILGVKKL